MSPLENSSGEDSGVGQDAPTDQAMVEFSFFLEELKQI